MSFGKLAWQPPISHHIHHEEKPLSGQQGFPHGQFLLEAMKEIPGNPVPLLCQFFSLHEGTPVLLGALAGGIPPPPHTLWRVQIQKEASPFIL